MSIAGLGVDSSVSSDGRAAQAPEAATMGREGCDCFFGSAQIERPNAIRIAAAALRGGCIDDVVDHVQAVGLAVGRHEFRGRAEVFAVRDVQLMKRSIAGGDEEGSHGKRRGTRGWWSWSAW